MPLTVFLADDHAIIRDGLRALLNGDEFTVIGEASNGPETLEKVQQLNPSLLIIDIGLPGLSGSEVTRKLCASMPFLRILALSMHAEHKYVVEMLQAGAHAYLVKETAFKELYDAIQEVMQGRRYLSQEIASTELDDLLVQTPPRPPDPLTQREREVLKLIAGGRTSKEIAMRLEISERTAETHRARIMDKLNLRSVAALTRYAIREGMIPLED